MARGAAKKTKPPKAVKAPAISPQQARNELSDDQRLALTLQHKKKYEAALAAKKKAGAEFLNCAKLIKSELGDDGIADIKDMIASESDGFEERLTAELQRQERLARWLNLQIGTQGGLFDTSHSPSQDEKGYVEGKRAGLQNEICKPPYGAGTDGYNGYMRGWHEGNAVFTTTITEQKKGAAILLRSPDNEPAGEDAFDKAAEGAAGDWPDDKQVGERNGEPAVAAEQA